MKKNIFLLILAFVFTFSVLISAEGDWPDSLAIGMVPSLEATRTIAHIEPLTDMLSEQLGMPVIGAILTSYTGVIEAMGSGRLDIGTFGAFSLVLGEERHGLEIILNTIRLGRDSYRAQFVVRTDSDIHSLEDLRNRTVAFVDPASASGFLFPFVHLLDNDIDPDQDLANYIFSGGHDASLIAVYSGDIDVAVTFEDARMHIVGEYPDAYEALRIIDYTVAVPNDGVAVRPGLHPDLKKKIQDAFIAIGETEEGRKLLQEMYTVQGYVAATSERYEIVRHTFNLMQDYIDF